MKCEHCTRKVSPYVPAGAGGRSGRDRGCWGFGPAGGQGQGPGAGVRVAAEVGGSGLRGACPRSLVPGARGRERGRALGAHRSRGPGPQLEGPSVGTASLTGNLGALGLGPVSTSARGGSMGGGGPQRGGLLETSRGAHASRSSRVCGAPAAGSPFRLPSS